MQALRLSTRGRNLPAAHWAAIALAAALIILTVLAGPLAPASSPATTAASVAPVLDQLPLAFVPVEGQSGSALQFEVYGSGNKLTFVSDGAVLEFAGVSQPLHMRYLGANLSAALAAGAPLPGIVNEYRGSQANDWQANQTTYASIHYQELYPGIDLRYAGNAGSLESIFNIAAGADPDHIRWQYAGSAAIEVDQTTGDLRITLPDQSQIVEQAPYAWQEINGQQVPVPVAFALADDNSVGFALGSYNPALPLIIDPTIVYETTLNLGYFDGGLDLTTDSAGNVYVLARVYDTNNDVLIAKLSPNGTLLFTTYLRGSSGDFGSGITLDSAGDIYVAGATDSADFPILNAAQPVKSGVTRDAFITKIAGNDGSLLFSTFFGGSRSDYISDITLNSADEIYLVGYTESTDFPTMNPIQAGLNLTQCFCEDTFVTRLTPDAMTVLYSTYLGGAFEDYGQSIALDAAENIYITGSTQSDDFPTQAAIQPNRAGQFQDDDLFVSKIAADGSSLIYSTYLGGTRNESARRIAVDRAGNAFVGGTTLSTDFPTTAGAYQETYIGGYGACLSGLSTPVDCNDMFISKLVPDGSSLAYSTYLGGGKHDYVTGITINAAGEAYVVGYTNSSDFPQISQPGIVIAKMNTSG
ncbi:MAG: SBBP repeat-containing protein, partial [Anaerolineales bacterium]